MSLSAQAAALLADRPTEVSDALRAYGRHLGIAYQLVDDLLDFTGSATTLGKPALADLHQGLATGPTLFAADEFPQACHVAVGARPSRTRRARGPSRVRLPHAQIEAIVGRRFSEEGDVAAVAELVARSDGVQKTAALATSHAQRAADALAVLPPSAARDAMLHLCFQVLSRRS